MNHFNINTITTITKHHEGFDDENNMIILIIDLFTNNQRSKILTNNRRLFVLTKFTQPCSVLEKACAQPRCADLTRKHNLLHYYSIVVAYYIQKPEELDRLVTYFRRK